ncbi:hypothetical protein LJ655_26085 [Paraburkholderia sp. MMS20-SJTN17]|uniref:Uncharacterized protein n=1 Tax=Paraburkholderia translucens TaxID=2886945 RepID=A0ABS8KKJ9_9BURK|nr:hypothetical protein [Paraburkholderia sp. MMS20-SJTN17]MCC8405291.1 hypothetical protein [Paraburkholderia sp. MMS20-SJTN17]
MSDEFKKALVVLVVGVVVAMTLTVGFGLARIAVSAWLDSVTVMHYAPINH